MSDVEDDQEGSGEKFPVWKSYKVTSEVTAFTKGDVLNGTTAVLSRFDFVYPSCKKVNGETIIKVMKDADGDSEVIRKNQLDKKEDVLLIEHQHATTLDLVGEQLWSGALFLADFVLHNPDIFSGTHILELASGVGLTSIVAAMFAKKVTITDINRGDILHLIERNIDRNAELVKADVKVKEIDFLDPSTIDQIRDSIVDVSILLAADVIYDNLLTDGFIRTVLQLMSESPNKTLYLAMEKRYVFTMEDMDSVAPCYEYLLTQLDWLRCQNLSRIEWTVELLDAPCEQYFTYERNRHLILWKIQAKLRDTIQE